MNDAQTAGFTLLERATSYCLGSLSLVTSAALDRRTPCAAWDLRALLRHMNDSVATLCEAVAAGTVDTDVPPERRDASDGLVAPLRDNACRLLGAWTNAADLEAVTIGDRPLPAGVVAGTGALEIAVHGWDVVRACGYDRPIPAALAEDLLELAPLMVTDADRPVRFARPVRVPPTAAAGARLVAFLGRVP